MYLFNYLRQQTYFFLSLIGVALLVLPQLSRAEDYYWTVGSSPGSTHAKHSRPEPACLEYLDGASDLVALDHIEFITQSDGIIRGHCYVRMRNGTITDTPYANTFTIRRFGNGCANPTVYNSETKSCETPEDQCSDKEGQSDPFSKSGPRGDGYYTTVKVGGQTLGVTPDSACYSGCTVNLNQSCVYSISADKYICTGTAYYTGTSCDSGTPAVESDNVQREPDPEITNKEEPCVYVQDAEGRQTCVSKSTLDKEGQNCGTAGPAGSEQVRCFPKQAELDEKKTETEVKEEPTPDGGKVITKTDVHTETKCQGDKTNCTTTTTTTTTTTKKDGSGSTTSTNVVCKGPKCGTDGKGGGGGGGGTGEDGSDEGTVAGPELGEVSGFGEATSDFISGVQGTPLMTAINGIGLSGGGSCSFPSATTMIGTISFNSICTNSNWLDPLYYVFLAIWAFLSVRVLMSA